MIPGLRVGHATDRTGLTGVTVVLPDHPAVGGVEVRGRAAGVHGLDFLHPRHLAPTLDGVVLAGGSAFGLESIWGVMQWLEEHGVGFKTRQTVVPHVAGAILYDLGVGDPRARPDRAMGYAAAALADPSRAARHIPFVRALAMRGLEIGTEVALGRVKLHEVSRAPTRT